MNQVWLPSIVRKQVSHLKTLHDSYRSINKNIARPQKKTNLDHLYNWLTATSSMRPSTSLQPPLLHCPNLHAPSPFGILCSNIACHHLLHSLHFSSFPFFLNSTWTTQLGAATPHRKAMSLRPFFMCFFRIGVRLTIIHLIIDHGNFLFFHFISFCFPSSLKWLFGANIFCWCYLLTRRAIEPAVMAPFSIRALRLSDISNFLE